MEELTLMEGAGAVGMQAEASVVWLSRWPPLVRCGGSPGDAVVVRNPDGTFSYAPPTPSLQQRQQFQ